MKRKQVNSILVNQRKRRFVVLNYTLITCVWFIAALSFMWLYINNNKASYVHYTEESDIDYQVYLKENDFYDSNYLEKDNQYIANLINYITSTFNYELEIAKDVDYTYSYTIESSVTVVEKSTNKNIYEHSEVLDEYSNTTSNSKVTLSKDVKIDYNYYNDLITKFVNVYDLDNVDSTLTISMNVNVEGNCDDLNADKESVISLNIPLTTNTVGIDIKENLTDSSEDNIMICNTNSNGFIYLVMSIIFGLVGLYALYLLIKYIVNTRTAESIYERELKKILNSYKSYIQKVNNSIDLKKYQLMKVDTFTDMLEIRDTINSPILMVESNISKGVFFCIPSNTNLLYVYSLKVSDIEKELKEKQYGKEK